MFADKELDDAYYLYIDSTMVPDQETKNKAVEWFKNLNTVCCLVMKDGFARITAFYEDRPGEWFIKGVVGFNGLKCEFAISITELKEHGKDYFLKHAKAATMKIFSEFSDNIFRQIQG